MRHLLIVLCMVMAHASFTSSKAVDTNVAVRDIEAIEIEMQGEILVATSDIASDPLTKIQVYNTAGLKVADTNCSTVKCTLNLSNLPRGTYLAVAYSKRTQYSEYVVLQ